jgi:orotate phosphoribosyltransferase
VETSEHFQHLLESSGAFKSGHFLLASGRHSGQYVEKFDLLRRPVEATIACGMIADKFRDQRINVVAGPTTGGIIMAYDVARYLGCSAAYAERKSDGGSEREFRRGTTFDEGSRVLVVDDILTTGGSLRETLAALAKHPVDVVGIAVLVDRSRGAVEFGAPLHALTQLDIETWEATACPLCAGGVPLVKPGSTTATAQ